jgi:tetratricopeptide (TPR) repeat protein
VSEQGTANSSVGPRGGLSARTYALAALAVGTTLCAAFGQRVLGASLFVAGLVGYVVWGQLRYRLALRRIGEARDRFDGAALRREVDALSRYANELSPLSRELQIERALALMMEERYAEAEETLAVVDTARVPERAKIACLGNRAFCHAQLGRFPEAVEEATESARRAEALGSEAHALHLGILGAVLVHAGQPERAIPLLESAIARGDAHPQLRAMRELYLGDALVGTGRPAEGRAAYGRAVAAAPAGPFARRARQRLESPP